MKFSRRRVLIRWLDCAYFIILTAEDEENGLDLRKL